MLVYAEIWYLHLFEYGEFNCDVHFFCFWLEIPFLGTFSVFDWKTQYKENLFQKIKEFNDDVHFFCFRPVTAFLGTIGPKS